MLSVEGVKDVELIARSFSTMFASSDNFTNPMGSQVIYLPNSSSIWDGWQNKPPNGIGENETYVLEGTSIADRVAINDTLMMALDFPTLKYDNVTTIHLNLTVVGFAKLTDEAYSTATGNIFYSSPFTPSDSRQVYIFKSDLMIVSWETIEKIWSTVGNYTFETRFLVSLNRDELLDPWDVQTSANRIAVIADNINNKILANYEYHGFVQNNLGNALTSFQYNFSPTFINFILVSLPVFFVAWYLGSTVSDV